MASFEQALQKRWKVEMLRGEIVFESPGSTSCKRERKSEAERGEVERGKEERGERGQERGESREAMRDERGATK